MKACTKCYEVKPRTLEYYPPAKKNADGMQSWCRDCTNVYSRTWRLKNKERTRKYHAERQALRRINGHDKRKRIEAHGLTVEQWDARLASQGGGCAICGATEAGGGRDWAIDHDHSCCPGKFSCGQCVRGLLCHNCNVGIGMLKDSPERIRRAIDYIERNRHAVS